MTLPSKLPTWATASPNVLEPSEGKKVQGWVPGEQPPAAFFNYWQNLVHQWIAALNNDAMKGQIRQFKQAITAAVPVAGSVNTVMFVVSPAGVVVRFDRSGTVNTVQKIDLDQLVSGGTWTTGTLDAAETGYMSDLIWDGSLFQIAGNSIQSSPDGVTWTRRLATAGFDTLAANPAGVRLAFSNGGTGMQRSTNGTTWAAGTAPPCNTRAPGVLWDAVRSRFIVVSRDGTTALSPDGVTWTVGGVHGYVNGNTGPRIAYLARQDAFVIGGQGATPAGTVRYSRDGGVSWLDAALPALAGAPRVALFATDEAVFVGPLAGNVFHVSDDPALLSQWTQVALATGITISAASDSAVRGASAAFGVKVASGYGRFVFLTSDAQALYASGKVGY